MARMIDIKKPRSTPRVEPDAPSVESVQISSEPPAADYRLKDDTDSAVASASESPSKPREITRFALEEDAPKTFPLIPVLAVVLVVIVLGFVYLLVFV